MKYSIFVGCFPDEEGRALEGDTRVYAVKWKEICSKIGKKLGKLGGALTHFHVLRTSKTTYEVQIFYVNGKGETFYITEHVGSALAHKDDSGNAAAKNLLQDGSGTDPDWLATRIAEQIET